MRNASFIMRDIIIACYLDNDEDASAHGRTHTADSAIAYLATDLDVQRRGIDALSECIKPGEGAVARLQKVLVEALAGRDEHGKSCTPYR